MENAYLAQIYEEISSQHENLAESFKKLRELHLSKVVRPPSTIAAFFQKTPQKSAINFLVTPTLNAWGINFVQNAMRYKMSGVIRCDKYRNYWVVDHTKRRGWRSVGENHFKIQFNNFVAFIDECQDHVESSEDLAKFNAAFDSNILQPKWKRRNAIIDSNVSLKEFVNFCRNEHKRLPSLRG